MQDVAKVFPWEQPEPGEVRKELSAEGLRHRSSATDEVESFRPSFSVEDAVEMQFGKMVGSPYWSTGTVVGKNADGTVDVAFGDKLRWMDRRPPTYFLKRAATGMVDGREVTWDPEQMRVTDTQSGAVLHDLRAAFAEMDRIIRTALFSSLRKIARDLALSSESSLAYLGK